jgi:hypothetical protein
VRRKIRQQNAGPWPGRAGKLYENFPASRRFEVQGDGFLAAVKAFPEQAVAMGAERPTVKIRPATYLIDADHFRAKLA